MKHLIAAITLGLCMLSIGASAAPPAEESQAVSWLRSLATPHGTKLLQMDGDSIALPAACCKVCTKGKPCGDTCISRDKICHVGPGCAC
jgi:hypothetical protein